MGPPLAGQRLKGYLPVRLTLPQVVEDIEDETFLFVKEHQSGSSGGTTDKGTTLFVANVPVVPSVQTKLLLQSIFGRYGEVARVTVVENPRKDQQQTGEERAEQLLGSWTTKFSLPSFLAPIHNTGRFAHVVFTTTKELKRTMQSLAEVMENIEEDNQESLPGLTLDKIELQTLADESERRQREEQGLASDSEMEERRNDSIPGILKVAERYRRSCRAISRNALLEECNRVMQEYEDTEEENIRARQAALNEPDEDGFITILPSSQAGNKSELESGPSVQRRRKGQQRSRKKKDGAGKSELSDFYRFQTKDIRKRTLQDLRQRFEEDLARVKRMKEENQYRPF